MKKSIIILLFLFPMLGRAQQLYMYQLNDRHASTSERSPYEINDKYHESYIRGNGTGTIFTLDNNTGIIKSTKYYNWKNYVPGLSIFPDGNKLLLENYGYMDITSGNITVISELNKMYRPSSQDGFKKFSLVCYDNNTIIGLSTGRDTVVFYNIAEKKIESVFIPNDDVISMCLDSNNLYLLLNDPKDYSKEILIYYSLKEKKVINTIDGLSYTDIVLSGSGKYFICIHTGYLSSDKYYDFMDKSTYQIKRIDYKGIAYGFSYSIPCLSSDDKYLYYVDYSNIYRCDIATSNTDIYQHKHKIFGYSYLVKISNDNRVLFISTEDNYLYKYSIEEKKFYSINSTSIIKNVAFSNDSKYIITSGIDSYINDELHFYAFNLASKELVGHLLFTPQSNFNTEVYSNGQGKVYSPFVLSEDNIAYTVVFNNGNEGGNQIAKLDVMQDFSYEPFIPIGKRTVTDISISSNNEELACSCTDSSILIVNLKSKAIKQIKIPTNAYSLKYDKEKNLLYYIRKIGNTMSIYCQYDLTNNQEKSLGKNFLYGFEYEYYSNCSFSANNKAVAIDDPEMEFVSVVNNDNMEYINKKIYNVASVGLNADNTLLAIGLDSARIDVYRLDSLLPLFSIRDYPYTRSGDNYIPTQNCIAISPDNKYLASANSNMNLCIWDISSLTGVDDIGILSDSQTLAYPNPVSDLLNIRYSCNQGDEVKLSVMDIFGRSLCDKTSQGSAQGANTISVNVGFLPQGFYFYRLVLNNKVFSNKFSIIR